MKRLLLVLSFVLVASPTWAALAVVNCATATKLSGASTTQTYPGALTSGSTLVAGGFDYSGGAPASPVISDSVNGAWTVQKYAAMTADGNVEVWLATKENSAAGTPTVTWDPNGTADMGGWFICEVTGAATASVDVKPAASQQNTLTPSIASGTLAQADEVLFAVMTGASFNTSISLAGDGTYTALVNQPDNTTSQMGHAQYKIVATTTSDQADWTVTDAGGGAFGKVSILISLKQAASGGCTAKPTLMLMGVGNCGG